MENDLIKLANELMQGFDPAAEVATNYEKLPDGNYKCMIESISYGKTKTGTDKIDFQCSILEGEYVGRNIWVPYYLSESALKFSIKNLQKLTYDYGYQLEPFVDFEGLSNNLQGLWGSNAIVNIKTKEGNEYPSYRVTPVI